MLVWMAIVAALAVIAVVLPILLIAFAAATLYRGVVLLGIWRRARDRLAPGEGERLGTIVGTVERVGPAARSPLRGRECVYAEIAATTSWDWAADLAAVSIDPEPIVIRRSAPFQVRADDGRVWRIEPEGAKASLPTRREVMLDATAETWTDPDLLRALELRIERAGRPPRVTAEVIEVVPGDRIAVSGWLQPGSASDEPSGAGPYRTGAPDVGGRVVPAAGAPLRLEPPSATPSSAPLAVAAALHLVAGAAALVLWLRIWMILR